MLNNDKEIIEKLKGRRLIDSLYRIIRWPKKHVDKLLVLEYLSSKISNGIIFTESEVNEIIMKWQLFDDYALVRREMFENGFIDRTNNCMSYWKKKNITIASTG